MVISQMRTRAAYREDTRLMPSLCSSHFNIVREASPRVFFGAAVRGELKTLGYRFQLGDAD